MVESHQKNRLTTHFQSHPSEKTNATNSCKSPVTRRLIRKMGSRHPISIIYCTQLKLWQQSEKGSSCNPAICQGLHVNLKIS